MRHQPTNQAGRVGYVVKRYPRYSETFIVNEILAHERAGTRLDIFALRPPADTHFQPGISQVRAPVHYMKTPPVKLSDFWRTLQRAKRILPNAWEVLDPDEGICAQDMCHAMEIAMAVRDSGIRHLHAHFATSAATVTRLAAKMAEVTYSITMHAKDIFHDSVQSDDLQRKIDDSEFVITVSDFNRDFLIDRFGNGEKIVRIYNGIDLASFPYQPPTSREPLIVGIGRLVPKKGFSVLIDACRLLANQGLTFRCAIAGSGELKGQLQEQIDRLNLDDRVELLGPKPQHEVKTLIHRSAVMAAPCVVGEDGNRDGLPTVLAEAMALGTPCVATDVTGIPEIVLNGETGLLVGQGSPKELSEALARLLLDGSERLAISRRARQLIEQQFEIDRNVNQVIERIGAAIQQSDNPPRRPLQFQAV